MSDQMRRSLDSFASVSVRAMKRIMHAHRVKLVGVGPQADLDVARHDLDEERLADTHGSAPRVSNPKNYKKNGIQVSNRRQLNRPRAAPPLAFRQINPRLTQIDTGG